MTESLLATDGYKFSMAEAGWPLRDETFYYSHRKGGLQVLPVDVEPFVRALLPRAAPGDLECLARHEYEMGVGFKAAMARTDRIRVAALPRGTWFFEREPVFTVSGPSALVSWLESLVLMLNFRIQVATVALRDRDEAARALAVATCEREKEIVLETLDWAGIPRFPIAVDEDGYRRRVLAAVRELVAIAGDPGRVFEVGMRAATCMRQHEIALEACREAGVVRTSNVFLAARLGMTPVGTMGHEHVQRYGSDEVAFRAMRDRRPNRSSFLLDTFDTIRSGLPAAFRLMAEESRGDSIRYDSGDKAAQYRHAVAEARRLGLSPVHILEDGFDAPLTRDFEALRAELGVRPSDQYYGYGGTIVARTSPCPLARDRVSAVWKLTRSGTAATMKFADEPGAGKESIPGEPVLFRRRVADRVRTPVGGGAGHPGAQAAAGAIGIVGQAGEPPPPGYDLLTGGPPPDAAPRPGDAAPCIAPADVRLEPSPATRALVDRLRRERDTQLADIAREAH
jgi:nicotinic acid phosphoribosyltransferase